MSKGVKLVEAEPKAAEELTGDLEAAVMDHLDQKGVARSDLCRHHISWRTIHLPAVCSLLIFM